MQMALKTNQILAFNYTNWQGDDHYYVVEPVSIGVGVSESADDVGKLVLHARVITRDGDIREELGNYRRRTFAVEKIRDLRGVNGPED